MTSEKLYEAIGDISDKKIKEAKQVRKDKKPIWLKWGTMVACLCLVVGVMIFNIPTETPIEETEEIDGIVEFDPIVADLAVYPEGESITNVVDIAVDSVYEEDLYDVDDFGKYLPTTIPEGYRFGSASLYKTTMNNGTTYCCLKTNYTFYGNVNAGTQEEEIMMLDYSVSVMNYPPKTEGEICTIDTIPRNISENETFILQFDDVYIEIISGELTYDEIMIVLNSIQ